ncbi:MAG: methyltransferase domain-containing protein [Dehalococcoidia bacterium]
MIHSVHIGDDCDLIDKIRSLHATGPRTLDATYGHGRFWNHRIADGHQVTGLDLRALDLARTAHHTLIQGSWMDLPFRNSSFDTVVLDPPFIWNGGTAGRMKARYTSAKSYDHLLHELHTAGHEFHRVTTSNGTIIAKAMDTVNGGARAWFHMDLTRLWEDEWSLRDLFVKVGVNNMRDPRWKKQRLSRASHTYFLVFKKTKY